MGNPSFAAAGDIRPCRFVKHGSEDYTVLEADAGERTCGISQEGLRNPDIPGYSAQTLAAAAGDQIHVFGEGDICLLELGSGGCSYGALLKSDADGRGVSATVDGDQPGAVALEGGSEGEKIRVQVRSQRNYY